jgi:hypothetical protein
LGGLSAASPAASVMGLSLEQLLAHPGRKRGRDEEEEEDLFLV